jgi:FAD/FMN-containing dehydrogenase
MIDRRPRIIARCVDVADVIAAVNFGREHNLLIAIRGGGPSFANPVPTHTAPRPFAMFSAAIAVGGYR